ncbi:MAG: TPM domain-containing protein [Candidatus Amulumruptor caecigallinarius]|nr:TPM domain-containing protein [Candidatus Amulumruptor caecigallinarius]MCM1396939.1 TPM domain-containing protein [Candidatus Amulumruptor caecigallinarius]MCM1454117.1 TPM domain-containing protein [bacterium]
MITPLMSLAARRALSLLIAVVASTLPMLAAWSIDDVPNVHLADSTRFVSNPAGVLSQQAVAQIDAQLAQIWRSTTAEPVVVVIDEADTDDLDTYATKLFEKWGIGKSDKDNGLLILISRDQRRAVIRTGQGMEGVIPDAYASRIIRNVMAPKFSKGDYDGGTIAAVAAVSEIVSDPEAAGELLSAQRNNAARSNPDGDLTFAKLFTYWFWFGLFLTGCLALAWIAVWRGSKGQSDHRRYDELSRLRTLALILGIFGCGIPFVIYALLAWQMRRIRLRPRLCPACHTPMNRLDEVTDNNYLTAPQNTEEQLGSVDYDVWLCPKCGDTIVEPYINKSSTYEVCDLCHTRAARLVANKVVRQPSVTREGQGVRIYHCSHCNNDNPKYYNIAKLPPVVIVPPIGGGSRGGGFGGGFGGGSFGGGSTMGGGASGGW